MIRNIIMHSIKIRWPEAAWNGEVALEGERLWGKVETSRYLNVSISTVSRWRRRGGGPHSFNVGALVRYRPADVRAFVECLAKKK
jgi:hypothetical protein